MKHFTASYIFTVASLIVSWFWAEHINPGSGFAALFIVLVLSILEISLSFDNAVINASKLEKMSEKWQKRFLTWGIFIAVFGMRLLFPIFIVSIFAKTGFLEVFKMAVDDSARYAHFLQISHPSIITFGGAFLIMLFFSYFFNREKEIHWIKPLEEKMAAIGHFRATGISLTLVFIILVQNFATFENYKILAAGISGIICYLLIDTLSRALENKKPDFSCAAQGFSLKNSCFINFLYLELIDASFSLDGVLGAFALSKDIVIIAIGLSIGAMFVRSLTILLVEKKTLKQYKYLEHGAHWAIGALAVIMFISAVHEVNEIITGSIGLIFIALAYFSSIKKEK